MRNTKILVIGLILVLGSLLGIPALPQGAHGSGSPTVFVSPNSMPLAPHYSLVSFNISVLNMPTFSGWDIVVSVGNVSVLRPVSITLVETFAGAASIFSNCVNGSGTGCTVSDGAGVAHSAVVGLSASDAGNVTLFTVTFNSTATSPLQFTAISLPSPTVSDPSGNAINAIVTGATYGNTANAPRAVFTWTPLIPFIGDNVTFNASNSSDPTGGTITSYVWTFDRFGQTMTVPITHFVFATPGAHTASLTVIDNKGLRSLVTTYAIQVLPRPAFVLTPNPSLLSILEGSAGTSQITVTSIGNFTGTVTLASSVFPPGPISFLNSTSLHITANGQNSTILTVHVGSSVAVGFYSVNVQGTSGTLSFSTNVEINVMGDFQFTASAYSFTIGQGTSGNATLIARSLGGFSGAIFISLNLVPIGAPGPVGLYGTLINTIVLAPGGNGTAYFTELAPYNASIGSYNATLTATSGTLSHSLSIIITVRAQPAFQIKVDTDPIVVSRGASGNSTFEVSANSLFHAIVSLSLVIQPNGLPGSLNITSVTLAPNGTITGTLTVTPGPATFSSAYFLDVVGSSGSMRQAGYTNVLVNGTPPPPPDFTIAVTPNSATVQAGNSASYTVALRGNGSFSGNVSLTAFATPSLLNGAGLALQLPTVIMTPNETFDQFLFVTTSAITPANSYTITVQAVSGLLSRSATVSLQVIGKPDSPPVANFTFTPTNPIIGQFISFDGSSSFDPDGTVVSWYWNFGDTSSSFGEFVSHAYFSPGNYTVTLTVQDNAGLSSSKSVTITVRQQPLHDVSIVYVNVQANRVVATESVPISVQVRNDGRSNETVSITAYANGQAVSTLNNIFVRGCNVNQFCYGNYYYATLFWDTTGAVPGNYTISATVFLPAGEVDPTPADNSQTGGAITLLPAPTVTLAPNTGVIGTKVVVQGSGFTPQQSYYPGIVYVNFDNMSTGFTYPRNGTFTFIFDVPLSQPGIHQVNVFDPYSGAHASATFIVQSAPSGNLAVSVDIGTIYFPGDTATAYILTTFNGVPIGPRNVQLKVTLFKPDGTNLTLILKSMGTGLYKATYTLPSTATIGTYVVVAKAHETGPFDASTLATFEVKLPWQSTGQGRLAIGAATVAGLVGLVGLSWKKGYLRRKHVEEGAQSASIL